MKIVIDTIPLLSPLTGVGQYTYQITSLLHKLAPEYEYTYFYGYYSKKLFTYTENKGKFYKAKEMIKKMPFLSTLPRRLKGTVNLFTNKKFDIYFETNFIPLNIKAKYIVATVYDYSFKVHPEWHPRDRINYYEKYFWKEIKKADHIITISDFIKKSSSTFGIQENKISAIHLGYDKNIFKVYTDNELSHMKTKYNLPDHFILFVGSVEPRKNLKSLLQAYMNLNHYHRDVKLVIAGFKGWENVEIMALLEKLKDNVIYLGYVPYEDLGILYNLATLLAYPSYYEGFGLPPLEAMACGCPVITSNVASLPEVCGEAALYVDPYSIESIAEGLNTALSDTETLVNLKKKGFDRAKLFSWEKAAKEHLDLFERMAHN